MTRRRAPFAAALLLTAMAASGCSAQPAPVEPTPLFSSEDEAFAAAEETYRAYVDAGNAARADANTMPDPSSFLTGSALDSHLETLSELKSAGLHLIGDAAVAEFRGESAELLTPAVVTAIVCLDVSGTALMNADGVEVTPTDRAKMQAINVTLISDTGDIWIAESTTNTTAAC